MVESEEKLWLKVAGSFRVFGYDTKLHVPFLESKLRDYLSSCGEITDVHFGVMFMCLFSLHFVVFFTVLCVLSVLTHLYY
ncbi:unnamed protein product [Brassica rapa subsp. trilocularis]